MARDCGVAPVTMWKAVQALKSQGILCVSRRGGIRMDPEARIGSSPGPVSAQPARQPRWAQVVGDLRRRLLSGHLPTGHTLPSMKTLRHEYGASYPVIRRALDTLVDEGLIGRHGRGYRQSPAQQPRATARLLVLTRSEPVGADEGGPWSHELWRSLELESTRRGMTLDVATYGPDDRGSRTRELGARVRAPVVQGVIVRLGSYSLDQRRELGHVLQLAPCPVVLLEEHGHYPIPRQLLRPPVTALITLGLDERDGLLLGRHLLQLGHRRAVCFSLVERSLWARSRVAGLTQAFDQAGYPDAVTDLTLPGFHSFDDIYQRILVSKEYHQIAQAMSSLAGKNRQVQVFRDLVQMVPYMFTQFLPVEMESVFRCALREHPSTAWVAVNDLVAVMARSFLERRNVPVPHAISVAGFDDSLESFRSGLTSYNFNAAGVVSAALEHITGRPGPSPGHRPRAPQRLYCAGYVVPRASTAPPLDDQDA